MRRQIKLRQQMTNEEGFFEFRILPFGRCRIEVEHPRFKTVVIENVALQVAQTASLTVTLQVGSAKESLVVHADSGLLETSDASLSQVIDDKPLLALPINGRNLMGLVSLSAGVIAGGRASATQRQANYGPSFSVGGQRDNTSVALIDGMEIALRRKNQLVLPVFPQPARKEVKEAIHFD